jgi:methionine-rich copper-binding protein CopC
MMQVFPPHIRRAVSVVSATVAVALLGAWAAPFHLHLVKSVPAANATVGAAPDSIRLWFSQTPELGVTTVKVTGPGAAAVRLAPLAKGDSSLVVAAVKGKMAAGAYTVAWRTMAKDGHVARGTFAFKIGAASGP